MPCISIEFTSNGVAALQLSRDLQYHQSTVCSHARVMWQIIFSPAVPITCQQHGQTENGDGNGFPRLEHGLVLTVVAIGGVSLHAAKRSDRLACQNGGFTADVGL